MLLIFVSTFILHVSSQFTFRNVMVTCDTGSPLDDEIPFSTVVTTTRLQPHLPSNQCYKISVQHSKIPVLYSESLSDINAKFLVLENNEISEIESGAFKNVKLKEALLLRFNKISEIRRGVFNNVQVPVLSLSFNNIRYIDFQAFDNMSLLENVQLDNNELTNINTFWFRNNPRLTKLSFRHNSLTEVPFNAFQSLAKNDGLSIDLSHNRIRSVDPGAFNHLRKLKFLSLAYNNLQTLDKNWLRNVKIDVLDLQNNRFWCLTKGLGAPPARNYLDGNPWECGCLEEMKRKEGREFGAVVAEERFARCFIR